MATTKADLRVGALRRFAAAITVFNLLGHTVFGFEQSWANPLAAMATAYAVELLLEWLEARAGGRRPRFHGDLFGFLLPPHITALSISMLLYTNDRLMPVVFATGAAVASKYLLRVAVGSRRRHVLNPSNFGIAATLILFPWVGIAQPYMFTENLTGAGDWILPAVIVCSGTFLNARFTRRLPLIAAWLGAFVLQALIRSLLFGHPWVAGLVPVTGVAFLLFTFYMITDPATTPFSTRGQVAFGAGVGLAYGVLMAVHVVFGLFFGLVAVCATRGVALALRAAVRVERRGSAALPATSLARGS